MQRFTSPYASRPEETRGRVDETWGTVREASREMPRLSEQAASLRRSAMENAEELRERSGAAMRSAQDMGAEHPLLLSAVGLAIGAVAGMMVAPIVFLDPNMMAGILLYGFAGALLGGIIRHRDTIFLDYFLDIWRSWAVLRCFSTGC